MFRFADPYYFFLLIPAGLAAWLVYRKHIRSGVLFAATSRIPAIGKTWRTYAALILPAFFILGLVLAVLALARPQTCLSKMHRSVDVIAIEMVVDCSGTMEALDMSKQTATGIIPKTRLDAVKEAFEEFIKERPDDLIGLITFGGFATSRAPLTADHAALLHVLKGVEVPKAGLDKNGQMITQEELLTAIGDGLATACARLEHAEPKTKIIVLLTDGESNTGIIKPEEAARLAKKMGIKVYTIGVGSTGVAPIMGRDMFGRQGVVQMQVSLDETLLRSIASTTDGRYFNVRDPRGLESAMTDINTLEKTKVEKDVYKQYNELFPWFLIPAVLLIVIGTGFNVMTTRRIV